MSVNGLPDNWDRKYISLDQVQAEEPPWILPHVLAVGFTCVLGPGRTYKTTFAVEAASSIALAKKFIDHMPKRPGLGLYYGKEQSARTLKFKAMPKDWWTESKPDEVRASVLCARDPWYWYLDDAGRMQELLEDIEEFYPSVVIFDPMVKFHKGDENDSRAIHRICDPLQELAHRLQISVVAIHHTRKLGDGEKITREHARGSSALPYLSDAVLLFTDVDEETGEVTIEADFRDHEGEILKWTPAKFLELHPEMKGRRDDFDDTVYSLIGQGVGLNDIAKGLRVRAEVVIDSVRRQAQVGRLEMRAHKWVHST